MDDDTALVDVTGLFTKEEISYGILLLVLSVLFFIGVVYLCLRLFT